MSFSFNCFAAWQLYAGNYPVLWVNIGGSVFSSFVGIVLNGVAMRKLHKELSIIAAEIKQCTEDTK
jgi:hypothetical protein